jgi:AraC-like DNA-binding protein
MSQIRQRPRWTAADEPHLIVRSLAGQFGAGQGTDRHAHPWRQLIYCTAGVMTVWTEAGAWVAPPHWAIWVPAGVAHQIRFAGACSLRTLYLRPDPPNTLQGDGQPADCAVITVSPLLRELVLRVIEQGMLDERTPADRAMALLIQGEVARRDTAPFDLPMPVSQAARRAADRMAADDAPTLGIAALADVVGLGPRTLERRFLAETGMTLAAWGRQARLLQAMRRLAAGAPVKTVAAAAGYSTASAFVTAFKGVFGETPGRYFGAA